MLHQSDLLHDHKTLWPPSVGMMSQKVMGASLPPAMLGTGQEVIGKLCLASLLAVLECAAQSGQKARGLGVGCAAC